MKSDPPISQSNNSKGSQPFNARQRAHIVSKSIVQICSYCSNQYILYACPEFITLSASQKVKWINSKKLCVNCLKPNHALESCNSKSRCRRCNAKHHSFLHEDISSQTFTSLSCHDLVSEPNCTELLGTAIIHIFDKFGNRRNARVLIDSGSTMSFIKETFAKSLRLKISLLTVKVSGIGDTRSEANGITLCIIKSRLTEDGTSLATKALVVKSVTQPIPSAAIPSSIVQRFSGLKLADPIFPQSDEVDLLIGVDIFPHIFTNVNVNLRP